MYLKNAHFFFKFQKKKIFVSFVIYTLICVYAYFKLIIIQCDDYPNDLIKDLSEGSDSISIQAIEEKFSRFNIASGGLHFSNKRQ